MTSSNTLSVEQIDGGTVVTLGSEYDSLDGGLLKSFEEQMIELAGSIDPPILIIDMTNTTFIGSAFLQILVEAWNRIEMSNEGRMILCGLQKNCKEVIQIMHLGDIWDICADRIEAIESLSDVS